MDTIVEQIILTAQSSDRKKFERALVDLRLIIERHTQNRYSEKGIGNYLILFNDKSLIDYRITSEGLTEVKYFLIYALFNFPDRAVLIAKCMKVLFDVSIKNAICAGLEIYMKTDDDTTCELIFSITDSGEKDFFLDKRVINLFTEISKSGGEYSREAVNKQLSLMSQQGLAAEDGGGA